MKWPEFNIFSDKSARIFLIFPTFARIFMVSEVLGDSPRPPAPVSYAYAGSGSKMLQVGW
jgi:hypothetical protein